MHLFHNYFWQVANCTTCAGACNCQPESSSQSRGRLRSANLSDVMETCSLAPTSFVCDHCRKVFANAKNLARHIEKYHKGWVFFVSKIDIYFFCRDTTTSSHSVGSASATLPLPSTSATSAAASASMMDYNCPECTWSGRTKNVLTRHIRAKHQWRFSCCCLGPLSFISLDYYDLNIWMYV